MSDPYRGREFFEHRLDFKLTMKWWQIAFVVSGPVLAGLLGAAVHWATDPPADVRPVARQYLRDLYPEQPPRVACRYVEYGRWSCEARLRDDSVLRLACDATGCDRWH